MAERSLIEFYDCKRRIIFRHPPPVIARGAKYMSLWRSLSSSEQEKLQSLLEQLKPVDQDRLLRVMDEWMRSSWSRLLSTPKSILLNVLTRLHPVHRSNVLRLLEPLDRQERERLIRVLYRLKQSEQVELLEILNEHDVLEQRVILKVMYDLCGPFRHLSLYYYHSYSESLKDVPNATTVLSLLKSLRPLDRLKLVRLLAGLNYPRQCKLLSVLDGLDRTCQCELVSILDGLDRTRQCKLVSVLERLKQQEQQQQLTGLIGLDSSGQDKLLEIIVQLKGQKKQQLLRVLDRLDSSLRQEILEVMVGLKLPGKEVLLQVLDSLGSPKRAEVLKVIREYCEEESYFTMPIPRLQIRLVDELDPTLYLKAKLRAKLRARLWEVQFLCWLRTLSIESGGSRNLLLDGWWLEFWEIILLAAGDVERNPGPRRMTDKELSNVAGQVLGKDDIFDVYDAVFDCRAKWNNLCLALRISPGDLSAVEEKRHGDVVACLRDGLSLWLQGCYDKVKYGPPTWRMLVDAVANSAGGDDHSLALEIAKEHRAVFIVPPRDAVGSRRDDRKRFEEMSRVFRNMYRSVIQLLRRVDVREVKDSLRHLTVPGRSAELCVPPQVYEFAASTKDLLDHLCPKYINPENTFILEDIVANFGSRRCKRLVQEYIDKFL